jgi:triosephosphate isomerase
VKYFLASWKMYPTVDEAVALLEGIQAGLRARADSGALLPQVIICPPFVALVPLRAMVDDSLVHLGAQNCHWEQEGPYTGEISARMLRGLAEYVLIGHSERRAMGETDEQIAGKVAAAAEVGVVPILFVGEDGQDSEQLRQTEQRLRQGLSGIDPSTQPVLVVYEPIWAIGVENAAAGTHVRRTVEHLKSVLLGLGVREPTVIYGGSVAPHNVDELAALDVLDGLGATRASLDLERLFPIVDRLTTRT